MFISTHLAPESVLTCGLQGGERVETQGEYHQGRVESAPEQKIEAAVCAGVCRSCCCGQAYGGALWSRSSAGPSIVRATACVCREGAPDLTHRCRPSGKLPELDNNPTLSSLPLLPPMDGLPRRTPEKGSAKETTPARQPRKRLATGAEALRRAVSEHRKQVQSIVVLARPPNADRPLHSSTDVTWCRIRCAWPCARTATRCASGSFARCLLRALP